MSPLHPVMSETRMPDNTDGPDPTSDEGGAAGGTVPEKPKPSVNSARRTSWNGRRRAREATNRLGRESPETNGLDPRRSPLQLTAP